MGSVLQISTIHHPSNLVESLSQSTDEIKEVQYGLVNQDWVNILNIFDQQPISRLANRQKLRDKKQLLKTPLDFDSEIKRQKLHRLSLLETISKSHKLDLFTYESVKIIIEHSWTNFGYGFFKL